jgi:hypothetical protein
LGRPEFFATKIYAASATISTAGTSRGRSTGRRPLPAHTLHVIGPAT